MYRPMGASECVAESLILDVDLAQRLSVRSRSWLLKREAHIESQHFPDVLQISMLDPPKMGCTARIAESLQFLSRARLSSHQTARIGPLSPCQP